MRHNFLCPDSHQFRGCHHDCQPTHNPPNCFQKQLPDDPDTVRSLLAAGRSRVSRYTRFLGRDGYGGVASKVLWKFPVAVGEVDRRVLVGGIVTELWLITCVWSRIGNTARTFHHMEQRRRGDFWFQSAVVTMLRVVTENKKELKQSEDSDYQGHPTET